MTGKELQAAHPLYREYADEWRFFIRSYFGGRMYGQGNYLLQHPFESAANYSRRKETSYYYNYCGPVVDIYVSHLFKKDARRDYGSLTGDGLFDDFCRDADLEGNSLRQFMREAQRLASVYGRVSIIADKPKAEAATVAEARRRGIRPYLALVTPENLLDWKYSRSETGAPVLDSVKIKEDEGIYRVWTREGWELWEASNGPDEAVLLEAAEHGLNEVPLVNLYNKRSGVKMLGISDIQDIAGINRNIYYLCSDAKEIIENTAFPMLAMPYAREEAGETREVGPHNIIQFDPSEPNSRPYWLEAPHSSLTEIREWVRQDIAEIYRIAKMGGIKASEDYLSVKSGAALEIEYSQLYSTLSEKADNLEQAEMGVLGLWARWQGMEFDGTIDYPDDFSVTDIERDLKNAIDAQSARVSSETFGKELQKKIAGAVLRKIDEGTMAKIYEEIESSSNK